MSISSPDDSCRGCRRLVLRDRRGRTGFNVFNHLSAVIPFLRDLGDVGGFQRVGTATLRVFGSAQHPIALSAALVMLAPLALYLARRYRQRRWLPVRT